MMTDDEGAYAAGTVILITAVAAALIDQGSLDARRLIEMFDAFAALDPDEPMRLKPLEQCASLLATSGGQLGHKWQIEFAAVQERLKQAIDPETP